LETFILNIYKKLRINLFIKEPLLAGRQPNKLMINAMKEEKESKKIKEDNNITQQVFKEILKLEVR